MKLLVTTGWPNERFAALRADFPQVRFVEGRARDDALREIGDAEAVFGHLSRDAFLAARRLRWVQCHGAGVEWMAAIPELPASDVIVTNTRGAHAGTIAEHTFGLLIALARGFPALLRAQGDRAWRRAPERPAVGLAGLTLGVIGLGNIGRAIARRGHAFEMTVIAIDANPLPRPDYVAELRPPDGLPDLLRRADAVVVATPLTAETRGLLGPRELALMKPGAFLIAISRGGIVDEAALIEALRDGRLAGAGLDVQAREPLPPDDPLWDAPNLILTPHCSGQSQQTTAQATAIFRENLTRFLAGQPLTNLVDKIRGY